MGFFSFNGLPIVGQRTRGTDIFHHNKAKPGLKAAHVVIITACGSIESAVEAMKHGAVDYFLKPFEPGQLMLLVAKLAGQTACSVGAPAAGVVTNLPAAFMVWHPGNAVAFPW